MSINVNDKNLGHATAYAYYKAGGGTMTEAEFTEFMADFGTASQTAVEAAQAALASKNAAQTAATTATNKASEATTAATTATTKAGEASTSASTATSAKDTAVSASQTATTKATEATTAAATATSAKTDAVAANTAAQSAKTAAQTAQTGAEAAAASVSASAAQIATNAEDISQLKSDISTLNDECGIYVPQTARGTTVASSAVQKVLDNVSIANNKRYNLTFTIGQALTGDIYIGFYEQGSTSYKFVMTLAAGATQKSQNFDSIYDITNGFIGAITGGREVDYTVTFTDVSSANAGSRIDSIEKDVDDANVRTDAVTKLWQSENLFSGVYEADKAIAATGELTTLTGYSASDFLRVQPGNTVYLSYQQDETYRNKANIQSYGIYDADYKLISASASFWNYKLAIPDNAQYIRIAYSSSYNSQALALNYNAVNQVLSKFEEPHYTLPDKITGDYTITNLVSPTNFLDEWSATSGTLGTNYAAGEVFATGSGGGSDLIINNSKAIPFVSGHRYYFRIKCKINKACNYIALRPLHSVAGIAQVFTPTVDFEYKLGMFVEPDHASGTCDVAFQIYAHFESASEETNAKLTIKEVMIVDTANLPDIALFQFDRLPYIYGTENIRLDEEAEPLKALNLSVKQTRDRTAVVTFVADDGLQNDYTKMRPLSEKYGVPMVMAVPPMIGWRIEERCALFAQNILGWEMASHSYDHVNLTTLTEQGIEEQLSKSKAWLEDHGLYCTSLVYPEGANNAGIRRLAKRYYQLACTTSPGDNSGVVPSFSIKRRPLGSFYVSGTYEEYKGYVDEAVTDGAWLVFMLHPSNAQHDATQQEYFEQIIQYVQSLNIPILTLRDAYMQYFGNVVEAGDYTGGADGVAIAGNGAKANI